MLNEIRKIKHEEVANMSVRQEVIISPKKTKIHLSRGKGEGENRGEKK